MTTPLPPGALTTEEVAAELCRPVEWVTARLGAGGWPTTQRSSDRATYVRRGDLGAWRELSKADDQSPNDERTGIGDPDE